jgi:hemerythrin-like domain-containing protein
MRHAAADIILDEHRSLGAVVHALQHLVRGLRDRHEQPDFRLLHAMLYYIREYPGRLHHPKEDRYLFKALRQRTLEADAVLDELEHEHAQGEAMLYALTIALSSFEAGADPHCIRFAEQVDKFAAFYWQHMRKEEELVLPLAERMLTDEDWSLVHGEFLSNGDPGFGNDREADFQRLFSRIVNLVPAPLGLG